MHIAARSALIVLAALLAAYIAVGTYTEIQLQYFASDPPTKTEASKRYNYDGVLFASLYDLKAYKFEQRRSDYFPWLRPFPLWLSIIVFSLAGGMLGGFARDLWAALNAENGRVLGIATAKGGVIAALALAFALVFPRLLSRNEIDLQPETLFGFCMISGVFSERIWEYLQRTIGELFGGGNV